MRRRRLAATSAAAALMVLLGACSAGGGTDPAAPDTSTPPAASSAPATASPHPPAADPLAQYHEQRLAWRGCGGAFECATLTVPLDYAHPEGSTLGLAVVRLPASKPDQRLGALVINPGGPGGSGVEYARAARGVFDAPVRQRYDIVGFDPRGVGASAPVECLTDAQTDAYVSADQTPDDPGERRALERIARQFAAGCATRAADTYGHISTAAVARDVDVLRAALGEAKLNWFGASYGTFIGATYADLFPGSVGRMVLDGAIDPRLSNTDLTEGQAAGFEDALRRFVADCNRRTSCPLPAGVDAGVARIQQFFASLDARPLPTQLDRPLNQGLGMLAVLYYLYFPPTDWQQLRMGLQEAFAGDGTTLLDMLDFRMQRTLGGKYKDNSIDALVAVNALDHRDRLTTAEIAARAERSRAKAPTFGPYLAWSDLVYQYWKVPPAMTPHAVSAPGAPPILVVGTTHDPATPYAWAQALADQLDSAVLLTRDGDGHTGYGMGSQCTDEAVDAYLVSGTTPPPGTVCS